MLLSNFVDRDDLRASQTFFNQPAVRLPRVSPLEDIPRLGAIALPDHVEPTALGLSRHDAFWAGYGMRVYDHGSGVVARVARRIGLCRTARGVSPGL